MTRLDQIEAAHSAPIDASRDRFGDHQDISKGLVLAWLAQFEDDDLSLAVEILEQIRYVNATNLREMTRQLRDMALAEFGEGEGNGVYFVPVGSPGSGSYYLTRVLAGLRDQKVHITTIADLLTLDPDSVDVIVFIEDFSGTGQTLLDWWKLNESIVLPLNAEIVVSVLLVTPQASERIQSFSHLLAAEQLDDDANVLSEGHPHFDDNAQERVTHYCEQTGCPPKYLRGYGECGLLVAFKHGCPNNSLPILWYSDGDWRPLFQRRTF